MSAHWPPLVQALQDPARYDHPVQAVSVVETHISFVLLTGPYAYKIKKPVDLGFADFSTLEKRYHACTEEVRINVRTAPELYLGVLAVTGNENEPVLAGPEAEGAFEYVVKMRQFPAEARLDRVLRAGGLGPAHMDALARRVAALHREAAPPPAGSDYGTPADVVATMRENFDGLRAEGGALGVSRDRLEVLAEWFERFETQREGLLAARREQGFIRECHGDLHLANMALLEGEVVPFDAIEFNPDLRFTDVMADVAFTRMDLDFRDRPELGTRFLNTYLERTGDYPGVAVLPFYEAYRALVRAKVEALTARHADDPAGHREAATHYVAQAEGYVQPGRPLLALTRGVTGVGKSLVSGGVTEELRGVRIRSDVERKRLAGLDPETAAGDEVGAGLYAEGMSERTYQRLLELARPVLAAGYPVILDATYLDAERRAEARDLAAEAGVPFGVLALEAPEETIRGWLRERAARGGGVSDGDERVLSAQLETRDPLTVDEQPFVLTVDTSETLRPAAVAQRLLDVVRVPEGR